MASYYATTFSGASSSSQGKVDERSSKDMEGVDAEWEVSVFLRESESVDWH